MGLAHRFRAFARNFIALAICGLTTAGVAWAASPLDVTLTANGYFGYRSDDSLSPQQRTEYDAFVAYLQSTLQSYPQHRLDRAADGSFHLHVDRGLELLAQLNRLAPPEIMKHLYGVNSRWARAETNGSSQAARWVEDALDPVLVRIIPRKALDASEADALASLAVSRTQPRAAIAFSGDYVVVGPPGDGFNILHDLLVDRAHRPVEERPPTGEQKLQWAAENHVPFKFARSGTGTNVASTDGRYVYFNRYNLRGTWSVFAHEVTHVQVSQVFENLLRFCNDRGLAVPYEINSFSGGTFNWNGPSELLNELVAWRVGSRVSAELGGAGMTDAQIYQKLANVYAHQPGVAKTAPDWPLEQVQGKSIIRLVMASVRSLNAVRDEDLAKMGRNAYITRMIEEEVNFLRVLRVRYGVSKRKLPDELAAIVGWMAQGDELYGDDAVKLAKGLMWEYGWGAPPNGAPAPERIEETKGTGGEHMSYSERYEKRLSEGELRVALRTIFDPEATPFARAVARDRVVGAARQWELNALSQTNAVSLSAPRKQAWLGIVDDELPALLGQHISDDRTRGFLDDLFMRATPDELPRTRVALQAALSGEDLVAYAVAVDGLFVSHRQGPDTPNILWLQALYPTLIEHRLDDPQALALALDRAASDVSAPFRELRSGIARGLKAQIEWTRNALLENLDHPDPDVAAVARRGLMGQDGLCETTCDQKLASWIAEGPTARSLGAVQALANATEGALPLARKALATRVQAGTLSPDEWEYVSIGGVSVVSDARPEDRTLLRSRCAEGAFAAALGMARAR